MPEYIVHHHHEPHECAAAFAAWTGFDSPLRGRPAASTCLAGDHSLWLRVEARDSASALRMLPRYLAERSIPIEVREIRIP